MSHPIDPRVAAVVATLTAPGDSAWIDVPQDLVESRALRHALAAAGWRVVVLDRAPVVDKPTLLHACYQSGAYPAGFGFNWDALADALRDLSWLEPAAGIAVLWRNPDVLEAGDPDTAATFREVVEEAAGERAAAGYPPLRVIQSRGSGLGPRVSD